MKWLLHSESTFRRDAIIYFSWYGKLGPCYFDFQTTKYFAMYAVFRQTVYTVDVIYMPIFSENYQTFNLGLTWMLNKFFKKYLCEYIRVSHWHREFNLFSFINKKCLRINYAHFTKEMRGVVYFLVLLFSFVICKVCTYLVT